MVREASGLLPSSPTKSSCVEAGLLPFDSLLAKVVATRATSYAEKAKHKSPQCLLSTVANNLFKNLTRSRLPKVLQLIRISDRIWNMPSPRIDWGLKHKLSTKDSPLKVQAEFRSTVETNYKSHIKLYTDGSKLGNNVGFGVYGPGINKSLRLPNYCSVFSAEAAALKLAVEEMYPSDAPVVIFTDSASVLKSIESGKSRHPWVQLIENKYKSNISFCWIPGHKGIAGNELADRLAAVGRTSQRQSTKVPGDDIRKYIASSIEIAWKVTWSKETDLFLRKVKGTTEKWNDREKRKEQRILSRLRVGHTKITHAHYLGSARDAPECEVCLCRLTVEHLLVSCPIYDNYRNDVNLPASVRDILSNDSNTEEQLLLFLKNSQLIDKI